MCSLGLATPEDSKLQTNIKKNAFAIESIFQEISSWEALIHTLANEIIKLSFIQIHYIKHLK